jgi:hypothetical protein
LSQSFSPIFSRFCRTPYAGICIQLVLLGLTMAMSECFLPESLSHVYRVTWLALSLTGFVGFLTGYVIQIFRTKPRKEVSHVQSC